MFSWPEYVVWGTEQMRKHGISPNLTASIGRLEMSTGLNDPNRCQWCGRYHQTVCPLVKSIEYHEGGVFIKRVEFFAPADYPSITPGSSTPAS
jgi:hypothetical protein